MVDQFNTTMNFAGFSSKLVPIVFSAFKMADKSAKILQEAIHRVSHDVTWPAILKAEKALGRSCFSSTLGGGIKRSLGTTLESKAAHLFIYLFIYYLVENTTPLGIQKPVSKNTIMIFYVQAQPHRGVIIQISFVRMAEWNSEYM